VTPRRQRAPSERRTRPNDARGVAHEILVRVETEDAFADVLLAHRLAAGSLGRSDRGLATELD
jgi:16S rRNA (cytosine967-C5)-methyltransferase